MNDVHVLFSQKKQTDPLRISLLSFLEWGEGIVSPPVFFQFLVFCIEGIPM